MPGDENPWATIMNNPPIKDKTLPELNAIITIPKWATDEYAINTFMSICRRQINLTTTAPNPLKDDRNIESRPPLNKGFSKNHLNPPNFSSNPAKIIEPVNGASTWALGNHKCTPYMGNLTKNADIVRNISIDLYKDHKFIGLRLMKKLN